MPGTLEPGVVEPPDDAAVTVVGKSVEGITPIARRIVKMKSSLFKAAVRLHYSLIRTLRTESIFVRSETDPLGFPGSELYDFPGVTLGNLASGLREN